MKRILRVAALVFGAVCVSSSAYAAIYCPGDTNAYTAAGSGYVGTTGAIPSGGNDAPVGWNSYVASNQFTSGVLCYYRDKNLEGAGPDGWDDFSSAGGSGFSFTNYTQKWVATNSLWTLGTGTTFDFSSLNIDTTKDYFIGLHFGGGNGAPDSFIVRLNAVQGSWTFWDGDSFKPNALSNVYLFAHTRTCPDGNCGGQEAPEPATLVLIGAALAGLGLVRRRRRN